jgi:hypothetical protein
MGKIVEISFTSSGTTQPDAEGTQDFEIELVDSNTYLDPLGGPFTIRPGWKIQSSQQNMPAGRVYDFTDPTYSSKSFVIWARFKNTANNGNLWSEHQSTLYGWYDTSNELRFNTGSHNAVVLPTNYQTNTSDFRMVVAAIDYGGGQTLLYADGQYVTTLASAPPDNPQTPRFGHNRFGSELHFDVGLLQIYDHLLTSGEVSALYDTGMTDALVQTPIGTAVGTVFDSDSVPISGATVAVYDHTAERLVHVSTSASGGDYEAQFPTVGTYSLYTTKPGIPGGRAFPVTVTSGGITFDTS